MRKWILASVKLCVVAALVLVSYCQGKTTERISQPFIKEVWLFARTLKNDKNQIDSQRAAKIRCPMAYSVVNDVLKKGMTRSEIYELLGQAEGLHKVTNNGDYPFASDDAVLGEYYYLGGCMQIIGLDPDILYLYYDEKNILVSFGIRNT